MDTSEEIKHLFERADEIIAALDVLGDYYQDFQNEDDGYNHSNASNLIISLKDIITELMDAGNHKALQHKRDKEQLEELKKRRREESQNYSDLYGRYQELNNKYTELAAAYSGVGLSYVNIPADDAIYSTAFSFCDSDAGASRAIAAAEAKLKAAKGGA